jgi:hypothetical protein
MNDPIQYNTYIYLIYFTEANIAVLLKNQFQSFIFIIFNQWRKTSEQGTPIKQVFSFLSHPFESIVLDLSS